MAERYLLSVRPDLEDVEPYVSPQQPARYRMNTNESPYPPPAGVLEDVIADLQDLALNRYPDRDAADLLSSLSELTGWPRDGLWVANGSNEVFMHLFLAYGGPGRISLTFEPTYSLHTLIPRIAGTHTLQVQRAEDYAIELNSAIAAIHEHRPTVVLVCSPNNPSGGCELHDTVRALAAETDGLVVVDEAYGEFADASDSVRPLLYEHRNLVLVKTFSKAWRLAGARIGYLLAAPEIVDGIARVGLPYHLGSITQRIGAAAIRHVSETLEPAKALGEERDRIAIELQAMGIKTFPSKANFVMFQVEEPNRIWEGLLERGVLIRNYSDYPGLEGCLRVTAGLPEESDAFVRAMEEVMDE
ncbi:MAG: histidinol-phosphate transaminase [Actinomycetota bacterium]